VLSAYLLSIVAIAGWWAVLAAAFTGMGLIVWRLFRPGPLGVIWLCVSFWVGWAATVALLQLWHLVLPVNGLALVALLALGALGLALEWRALLALAGRTLRAAPALVLLAVGLVLWAANRSTGPVQNYDLGLYYLQSVAWSMSYPVVPGLGNLHGRLAFNNAYFLYAALANVGPLAGLAHHTANGVLLVGLLLQGLAGAAALALRVARPPTYAIWAALCLAPALAALFGSEPSSPIAVYLPLNGFSPDEGVFVLGLVVAGLLATLLLDARALTPPELRYLQFALVLLACVGVAVKLSFVAFAAASVAVAYMVALLGGRPTDRRAWAGLLLPPLLCALLVLGIWAARGVILSGYPAYPSTIGAAPVPWRVPTALVLSEANWVRSWARQPDVHWAVVLGSNNWLQPWLNNLPPIFTKPLWLALVGGLALLLAAPLASAGRRGWLLALGLLLPAVCSILFWFVTAPGYRFGGAAFWVLALVVVLLLVQLLVERLGRPIWRGLLALAAALALLLYAEPLRNPLLLAGERSAPGGLPPLPTAPATTLQTTSGLQVVTLTAGNQCWAAPIPCTPYFREGLRLREPDNLGAGFVLAPQRQFVDMHGSDLPVGVDAPVSLGVALPAGWEGYDQATGERWMQDEGMILVYSEQPRQLRLRFQPVNILGPAGLVDSGRLLVAAEGEPVAEVPMRVGQLAEAPLALEAGFTRLTLRLEGGAQVPAEVIAGSGDTRRLSVSLRAIALIDE
jgi:hypothetical protein